EQAGGSGSGPEENAGLGEEADIEGKVENGGGIAREFSERNSEREVKEENHSEKNGGERARGRDQRKASVQVVQEEARSDSRMDFTGRIFFSRKRRQEGVWADSVHEFGRLARVRLRLRKRVV